MKVLQFCSSVVLQSFILCYNISILHTPYSLLTSPYSLLLTPYSPLLSTDSQSLKGLFFLVPRPLSLVPSIVPFHSEIPGS